MSKQLRAIFDATIHDGQLAQVREVVEDLVANVEANEPDTTCYEAYLDDATGRLCVLETYASSQALLDHVARPAVAQALDVLMANVELNGITVFGEPTEAARDLLAGFNGQALPALGGFDRHRVIAAAV